LHGGAEVENLGRQRGGRLGGGGRMEVRGVSG